MTNEPTTWNETCSQAPCNRGVVDSGSPEADARDRVAAIGFAETERRLAALTAERDELKAIVDQVDDVLVVNWIAAKDGDYRQALHDLVTTNIAEHDDPAISSVAKARQDERDKLITALRETREALVCIVSVANSKFRSEESRGMRYVEVQLGAGDVLGMEAVLARHAPLVEGVDRG